MTSAPDGPVGSRYRRWAVPAGAARDRASEPSGPSQTRSVRRLGLWRAPPQYRQALTAPLLRIQRHRLGSSRTHASLPSRRPGRQNTTYTVSSSKDGAESIGLRRRATDHYPMLKQGIMGLPIEAAPKKTGQGVPLG